ncbi:hypothetical protein NF27_GS00010 [Candidatus Jidaibacter acanthamoeba]|uniref:Uncharacterized protein n=1 Tax=Candidatus Jidaibacter acanthamoebae TaxID=86105 RepID=A0A0C1QGH7_9RICK|nr:hypothetical protein [Candidatus Jidaibacter acanthamoeba]KIE04669.1 hypothetical protein NF27_GS00010 [Candidatus Jidaibacter acanthamoeba]
MRDIKCKVMLVDSGSELSYELAARFTNHYDGGQEHRRILKYNDNVIEFMIWCHPQFNYAFSNDRAIEGADSILVLDASKLIENHKKDFNLFCKIKRANSHYNADKKSIIIAVDCSINSVSEQSLQELKQEFQGVDIVKVNLRAAEGISELFEQIAEKNISIIDLQAQYKNIKQELIAIELRKLKLTLQLFLIKEIKKLGVNDRTKEYSELLNVECH